MADIITLCYRRDEGDTSTGSLTFARDGEGYELESFHRIEFIPMMRMFAKYLAGYPMCRGAFQRTDRQGLSPLLLTEEEEFLFRTDPAEAIQQRLFPAQETHVR